MKQSRLFGIVLTMALAILFFTAVAPAVVSAATIYVPEGGNQTIQQAVNNATAGDTIIVHDGTYHENVNVDVTQLTIQSENGSANCVVNASDSTDYVFIITADYVNITGFAVENATGNGVAGIYLHDADNCRVVENNVTNNENGIQINTSSDNVIAGNVIHHNFRFGVWIHFESNNNRVENNTVYNQTSCWNGLGIGIFENSQHNYVYNNTVHDNTIDNIELWWDACYNTVEKNRCYNSEYGILATNNTNHNRIIDNELYENDYGIGMGIINESWGLPSPINNSVYDNLIHDNMKDGIFLDRTDDNTIYDNNCSFNNGQGIYLNCSSNNNITNNTANSNREYGIHLHSGSDNNFITNNAANDNTGVKGSKGIVIEESSNNTLTHNVANGNSEIGIWLESNSYNNTLINNTAKSNQVGIWLESNSYNNSLTNNTANDNAGNGIYLDASSNNTVTNNTASNNDYGIYLEGSSDNTITNNTAYNNSGNGIGMDSSSNNNITNNNVSNNDYGIYLELSCDNEISYNTVNDNEYHGIRLYNNSADNEISGNFANNNRDGCGIRLELSCSNNNVMNNTANDNDWDGISIIDFSNENTIVNNSVSDNADGIWIENSAHNKIENNDVSHNLGETSGIHLENANYTTIAGNNVTDNDDGIYLSSSFHNNVTCNWVHDNQQIGFYLSGGSTGNNISLNNIMHNGVLQANGSYHWNFYNNQTDAVDARHNYWVVTDNDTIDKSIYDDEDGGNKGEVTFYPPLEGASPCAPIPELATVVLFSIGLLALLGYIRIRRKDKV